MNREELEKKYGDVWDTKELVREFEVISFLAPYVTVINRISGKRGTMTFQDSPRFYFNFIQGTN